MSENLRVVAYVVTTAGLELGGFVEYQSAPVLTEDGKLVTNSALGTLIEIDEFWLHKPVKAQLIMTNRGPSNALIPVLQMTNKPDQAKVLIRKDALLHAGRMHEKTEADYIQSMSGIALPQGAGSLITK